MSKPELPAVYCIVDSTVGAEQVEKIITSYKRFAIENTDTGKIVVGMNWQNGNGIRYRPVMLDGENLVYGNSCSTSYVNGIGISVFEEIVKDQFEKTPNEVYEQERSSFERIVLKQDFGTGATVTKVSKQKIA